MNNLVKAWLAKEGIDYNFVKNKVDCSLLRANDVNPIVSKYGIYYGEKDEKISIGDIIGFENDGQTLFHGRGKDIFEELNYLFNGEGGEYTSRSLGMLDYSKEEILNNLAKSFEEQPITVIDVGDGKFSVAGNGKHRFTLLKAFYLSELSNIDENDIEKIQQLKDKYTIPVKLSRLDYNQTYSVFFIYSFGFYEINSMDIKPEPQESRIRWKGKEYISYYASSLINLAKRIVTENKNIFKEPYKGKREPGQIYDRKELEFLMIKEIIDNLQKYYRDISSFNKYVNNYMKESFLGSENEIESKNVQYPSFDEE